MNRHLFYLPCAVLAATLVGCSAPPHKDIPLLTSEVDAVVGGFYGQSIYHEGMAQQKLDEAYKVLKHWQTGEYWNIDEGQQAVDAARAASGHRLESEKALCQWLTSVHGANHHQQEVAHHDAAYFRTASDVPYSTDMNAIRTLGLYLQTHPDAFADVTAYTDTVGSTSYNQDLAERRAGTVAKLLVEHGAKNEQLRLKAMGEAEGPDSSPNQQHRVVMISTDHPAYEDCAGLK